MLIYQIGTDPRISHLESHQRHMYSWQVTLPALQELTGPQSIITSRKHLPINFDCPVKLLLNKHVPHSIGSPPPSALALNVDGSMLNVRMVHKAMARF